MTTHSLADVYASELKDLWSANDQMVKVVKVMSTKAHDPQLKQALETSVAGITQHADTLKQLLTRPARPSRETHCRGWRAWSKAATKQIADEASDDADLLDIESFPIFRHAHYGLAGFVTAAAYAQALRKKDHVTKLSNIVKDIYQGDHYASKLAERVEAAAAQTT